jgi:hypothetical protein
MIIQEEEQKTLHLRVISKDLLLPRCSYFSEKAGLSIAIPIAFIPLSTYTVLAVAEGKAEYVDGN